MQRCHVVVIAFACCIMTGCGAASKSSPSSATSTSAAPISTFVPIAVLDSFPISGWQTCGTCGNTGGSSSAASADYSVADAASPSVDGQSSKFAIAATNPYANAYWWYVDSATYATSRHVAYEFKLY